jgi:ABC-2 type transport system permease protein
MYAIWAICRRDLRSVFASPLMWLVLATWIMLIDLVFSCNLYLLNGHDDATPLFVSSLSSGIFFLILLAPAITMNAFAQERVQGTLQLLLTVPIRDHQLVLGKFLAAFLSLGALVIASLVQPISLYVVSTVPLPQLMAGYLGLLAVCALLAALGVWISLLVESPVSAYVITFGVIALLCIIGMLPHDGPLSVISEQAGLTPRSTPFFFGDIRLGNLAYFLGGAAICLVMAHGSLSARRLHG